MPVHFSCPHCHVSLSTAKRKAGLAVPCPKCRIGILVPPPEAMPAFEVVSPVVAPAAPARRPWGALLIVGVVLVSGWCIYEATVSAQPDTVAVKAPQSPLAPPVPVVPNKPAPGVEEPAPFVAPVLQKETPKPTLPPAPPVPPKENPKPTPPLAPPVEQKATPKPPPAPPQPPVKEKPVVVQKPEAPAALVSLPEFPRWTEEELRRDLGRTPELRLKQQTAHQAVLFSAAELLQKKTKFRHTTELLVAAQPELAGMPFRKGADCELDQTSTINLHFLSARLRQMIQASSVGNRPDADRLRLAFSQADQSSQSSSLMVQSCSIESFGLVTQLVHSQLVHLGSSGFPSVSNTSSDWKQPAAIPTLTQMLQAESGPVRLVLVDLLGQIPGEEATHALAHRAVFDLSRDVRHAAVKKLKLRPVREYRDKLLAAFRHPWPPAPYHAAEALTLLEDKESVPRLRALLEEPDPRDPFVVLAANGKETLMVREVVKVGHLANCLMCHPASFQETDPVRGKVPVAGRPLNSGGSGGIYGSSGSPGDETFIRADITYLRQDFSLTQPVPSPGFWPKLQRFDYLVRLRPAAKNDLLRLMAPVLQAPKLKNPRDEALRLALSHLDPSPPVRQTDASAPRNREPEPKQPPKNREPEKKQPPPKLRQGAGDKIAAKE